MKKTFDAVAFQRRIRRALSRRYTQHPDLEEKDLAEVRRKYNFPEPAAIPKTHLVAESRARYGRRMPRKRTTAN